ncbi:MAG TPA: LysM domain-containing protein [Candidatus Dormibacteraeota bacterium]|nr:LysM domain-containing protein [Candidatus Dormibacteraeota bacterium]
MAWPRLVRPGRLVLLLLLVTGCASPSIRAPIDLSGPDWTRREGQAVWQLQRAAAGVAGELLVATHPNGSALIQFSKPPLPFAIAQRTSNSWQIQFFAQNRSYSGPGRPPSRILWLQLPDALAGHPAKGLRFGQRDAGRWVLENPARGETLSGFLTTTQLPATHLVRPGETLPQLALRYGIPAATIEAANAGPPSAWFKVGNRIRLPPLKATSTAP